MENGYGGPVWHASTALLVPSGLLAVLRMTDVQRRRLWLVAEAALDGVGDLDHEFRERLARSLHIKRRLTPAEWGQRPWGMDFRATEEGRRRLQRVADLVPAFADVILAELT